MSRSLLWWFTLFLLILSQVVTVQNFGQRIALLLFRLRLIEIQRQLPRAPFPFYILFFFLDFTAFVFSCCRLRTKIECYNKLRPFNGFFTGSWTIWLPLFSWWITGLRLVFNTVRFITHLIVAGIFWVWLVSFFLTVEFIFFLEVMYLFSLWLLYLIVLPLILPVLDLSVVQPQFMVLLF